MMRAESVVFLPLTWWNCCCGRMPSGLSTRFHGVSCGLGPVAIGPADGGLAQLVHASHQGFSVRGAGVFGVDEDGQVGAGG